VVHGGRGQSGEEPLRPAALLVGTRAQRSPYLLHSGGVLRREPDGALVLMVLLVEVLVQGRVVQRAVGPVERGVKEQLQGQHLNRNEVEGTRPKRELLRLRAETGRDKGIGRRGNMVRRSTNTQDSGSPNNMLPHPRAPQRIPA
jgi:hypothetical protein